MPRKKVQGPATAEQVLDYFETASDVEVRLVATLVEGRLKKRFAPSPKPMKTAPTGSAQYGEATMRKPRAKRIAGQAPAQYGETLSEA